ncbi:YbdD/YjiX family protein [Streptomyces sp. NPDC056500]|uniref:YbdD/YjiX family protein n=1 Tax=Streptomyces sp. NPDC056500 TaxID=3345840 RepID=UPI0036C17B03
MTGGLRSLFHTAQRTLGGMHWYLQELTGETAYERHCARHRKKHPLVPAPTRREFQRMRARRREAEPGSGCC